MTDLAVARKLGTAQRCAFGARLDPAACARASTFDHGDADTRRREASVQRARDGDAIGNSTALTSKHKDALQCAAERSNIVDESVRALAYTLDQDTALEDYISSCTDETSNVSDALRCVNAYLRVRQNDGTAHFRNSPSSFFDDRLSTFGTMVARRAYQLEHLYEVLQMHRELFAFEIALMDTTRHEHDLHWHVWCFGPPSVGKSFCGEFIEHCAIPGTVEKIDTQTDKADAIETDRDDVLLIYGEMPEKLACWIKGSGNNGPHEQFKDRLSSMRQHTQTFYWRVVNGQEVRSSKVCKSSQIGCVIGLMNMTLGDMAPAIAERGAKFEVADTTRQDKTFADVNSNLASRHVVAEAAQGVEDARLLQALHTHVWKQIYAGVLTDVSTPVLSVYLPKLDHVLKSQFAVKMSSRDVMRIRILVKNLVIREALFRLYQHRTSPLFDADVDLRHLRNLDPWLKDHQVRTGRTVACLLSALCCLTLSLSLLRTGARFLGVWLYDRPVYSAESHSDAGGAARVSHRHAARRQSLCGDHAPRAQCVARTIRVWRARQRVGRLQRAAA